jgi:hypothetical protein
MSDNDKVLKVIEALNKHMPELIEEINSLRERVSVLEQELRN